METFIRRWSRIFAVVAVGIAASSCMSGSSLLSGTAGDRVSPSHVWPVPGEEFQATLDQFLDEAEQEDVDVDVLHFSFFSESGTVRDLALRLIQMKKSRPNRRIRVVLEGKKDMGHARGVGPRNALTADLFANTGIDVQMISGVQAQGIQGVTHAKLIRVGDKILSGSTNLSNTSIEKNNEFNLAIVSPDLANESADYITSLIANPTNLIDRERASGAVTMLTDSLYFSHAMGLIDSAGSGSMINLATYFFAFRSDQDIKARQIFDALKLARKRGAEIRVFLEQNSDPTVNQSITEANLRVAKILTDEGIARVYLDPSTRISHGKIIVVETPEKKAALVGSTNLYRGDFDENHQVNFLVEDDKSVSQILAYLDRKAESDFTELVRN